MTEFTTADNIYKELQKILGNLKKNSLDRVYAHDYVVKKRIYVQGLHENFLSCHKSIVKNSKPSELESVIDRGFAEKKLIDQISEILNRIQESINEREKTEELLTENEVPQPYIEIQKDISGSINNFTMSNFNFETGLKLPTLTDDKDEFSLRDFLDTVQSYHDTLNAEGKAQFLKFVCLNRVQGKAKTRLGDLSQISTFNDLKKELFSRCGTKDTIDSVNAK